MKAAAPPLCHAFGFSHSHTRTTLESGGRGAWPAAARPSPRPLVAPPPDRPAPSVTLRTASGDLLAGDVT